jgi:UDP-glucose 4-epimerase
MKVLVTGGLGVNGAWLVRELVAGGHETISFDNRADLSLVADITGDFGRHVGNILDVQALTELCKREQVECVAHLAAIIGAEEDPYTGFAVNAHGTVTVLEAARLAGVRRVVYTSSKAIYGPITGEHGYPSYQPLSEDHPLTVWPAMPVYSSSKHLSEEAGRFFAGKYGLEFAALRFATIFGPGKKARHGPIGVLSTIVENALLGQGTEIPFGGDERDDMVYVKDVARSIALAVNAPRLQSSAFNVGSGRLTSLEQFATAVRQEIADVEIVVGSGRNYLQLDDTYCLLDISRAREELGYEPAFSLNRALADYGQTMGDLGLAPEAEKARPGW